MALEFVASDGEDFRRLGLRFRTLGKDGAWIRRETTKRMQKLLRKITDDQKKAVLGLKVKGVRGRGTARRQAFHEAAALRGKRVRARKEGHGLRAQTARGIKSKVSWSGRKLGARISVDTSHLPPSQRSLPRHLDNPRGWRHPLWGNRKRWYGQVGGPYFSGPIGRWRVQVKREIKEEIDNVMRMLK